MDLLTDVLRQAGLRRRLLHVRGLAHDAPLRFPCDRSIGLHVVTRGSLFLHTESPAQTLALQAGDLALMARGCNHVLSTDAQMDPARIRTVVAATDAAAAAEAATSAVVGPSALISGAYQFWNTPIHPLFSELPVVFVLRADRIPKLGPVTLAVAMLAEEAGRNELGSESIVNGLLDVIFSYAIRAAVAELGGTRASWSLAVRDPQIRQALDLLHDDCAHGWTLDELSRRVAMSRTSLAERFRQCMGDTPLNYLRAIRMQKAMWLLSESDRNLEQIGMEVGYQDAFSFSKVFKRTVGVAPKEFRQRDTEEKSLPWRVRDSAQQRHAPAQASFTAQPV